MIKIWGWFSEWLCTAGVYYLENKPLEQKTKWWAIPLFRVVEFVEKWKYILCYRGVCALYGCKEISGAGWCKRCGAEEIYGQIQIPKFFYKDQRFKNFIEALKGE